MNIKWILNRYLSPKYLEKIFLKRFFAVSIAITRNYPQFFDTCSIIITCHLHKNYGIETKSCFSPSGVCFIWIHSYNFILCPSFNNHHICIPSSTHTKLSCNRPSWCHWQVCCVQCLTTIIFACYLHTNYGIETSLPPNIFCQAGSHPHLICSTSTNFCPSCPHPFVIILIPLALNLPCNTTYIHPFPQPTIIFCVQASITIIITCYLHTNYGIVAKSCNRYLEVADEVVASWVCVVTLY